MSALMTLTTLPAEDILTGVGGMTPGVPASTRETMVPKFREGGLHVVHAGGTITEFDEYAFRGIKKKLAPFRLGDLTWPSAP